MPRAATERALAELELAMLGGELPVVLTGPPGIGKTLLLRVAERRLAGRLHCVYLAYAALPATELCVLILGLLGESVPRIADAEAALLATAQRFAQAGTPLVLLIDDANAVPAEAAERVRSLAENSRGALAVVAAGVEEASLEPWVSRFGTRVVRVRIDAPMSAGETTLYIRARLERGRAPDRDRDRLNAKVIERIYRRSNGIPRSVQALASEFLRVGEAALPGQELEALLAQEDTVDLGALVAASVRPHEVPPVVEPPRSQPVATSVRPPEGPPAEEPLRLQPVATSVRPPEAPPAEEPPRSQPVSPPVPVATAGASAAEMRVLAVVTRLLTEEPPLQPTSERLMPEPPKAPVQPMSARATPDMHPRERTLPPAPGSPRLTTAEARAKQAPPQRAANRVAVRNRILIALLGLGGATALAMVFLRTPSVLPGTPARVPTTEKAPPEQIRDLPSGVASPQAHPPEELDSLRASPPEASVSPESVAPEPSSAAAPSPPPVAEVPRVAPIPVHINATPWATIEVDGVDMGETPIAGVPLLPGIHVFRAKMSDGRVIERTVQIRADSRHVTFD